MKKKKKTIPRELVRTGQIVDQFETNHRLQDKFRSSNLCRALREAVYECRLFVMPEGFMMAYCRGTGPVALDNVRIGGLESEPYSGQPFPKHMLSVSFTVRITNEEDEDDRRHTVYVSVPYRFCGYKEFSKGIPGLAAPFNTDMTFGYKPSELNVWIAERQMAIYADAEAEIHARIANLKKAALAINKNSRRSKPEVPHQSGF